ncbi:MAG TPA: hypothetical protein VGD87_15625, partial [Archangium sp.]
GYTVGWMSSTRAYGIEGAGASPRVIHLVKSGTASTESDIGPQTVQRAGPLLVFSKATPGKWAALLGDGTMSRSIDIPTTVAVTAAAARQLGSGPLTRYGIVSFDTSTSFIVDDTSVRQTPAGQAFSGGALRSGPTEYALINRSGLLLVYVFNTNAQLEVLEFGNNFTILGTFGLNGWTVIADDARTIMLGGFQ